MITLALDTSSRAASCALQRDDVLLGEQFLNGGLTHSQTILPMVQALLAQTGTTLLQVDRLAVSTGPGSFTGLRIGLSAVKGLGMSLAIPCVGVSTLDVLARSAACHTGVIAPVMDARRSQVYTALFSSEHGRITRLTEDMALPIATLGEQLRSYSAQPVLLVGDGAVLCHKTLCVDIRNLVLAPEQLRHQRACFVAAIASACEDTITPEELAPVYLRLPQAERERLERQQRTEQTLRG